jgi:hypothetical protein
VKGGEDLEHRDRLDRPVVAQIDRHGWVIDEVLSDTGKVRDDRDVELAEGCWADPGAHQECGAGVRARREHDLLSADLLTRQQPHPDRASAAKISSAT